MPALPFSQSTRLKDVRLGTITRPTGGGPSPALDMPRTGILQGISLTVRGSVAGTLSVPNAYGMSSILRRIRLTMNTGMDLVSVTGAGMQWLLRDVIDLDFDSMAQSTGRNAVTATTFNIDCHIPVALNSRDEVGLILLQSEQAIASLVLEWEADATVATGATVTATCIPTAHILELPKDRESWPKFDTAQTIIEEQFTATGAQDVTCPVPRGNVLLGLYYLIPPGFTRFILRAQQSYVIADYDNTTYITVWNRRFQRDMTLSGGAITGADKRVHYDMMVTDGVGSYGTVRDTIDSQQLTDIAAVITTAGAGTISAIRRQLIKLA